MSVPQVRSALAAAIGVALCAVVSCDDNPTSPSRNGPAPAPSAVTVVRLEIGAPEAMAPGTSAPLTARAVRSDGSTEDVTARAQWSSTDTGVVQVAPDGGAVAGVRGEARVTARLETRTADAVILVLPEGTFRLRGEVRDQGIPLPGARLVVIAGTGEGLSATTDGAGAFALYGVAGSIRLHGKKEGYQNLIADIHVGRHETAGLSMTSDGTQPRPAAVYTLTLSAGGCPVQMPAESRRRTYEATLEQQGTRVTVRLGGADFIIVNGSGNAFSGLAFPDGRVDFYIGNYGYYYYGYYPFLSAQLVERLSDGSTLLIAGYVRGRFDADGIAGTMDGYFSFGSRTTPPFWPNLSHCYSTSHGFDLRRR